LTKLVRWNSLVLQLSLPARKSFGAMIAWRMTFGGIVNRSDKPLPAPEAHLASKWLCVRHRSPPLRLPSAPWSLVDVCGPGCSDFIPRELLQCRSHVVLALVRRNSSDVRRFYAPTDKDRDRASLKSQREHTAEFASARTSTPGACRNHCKARRRRCAITEKRIAGENRRKALCSSLACAPARSEKAKLRAGEHPLGTA
jgi:hypothetical protein